MAHGRDDGRIAVLRFSASVGPAIVGYNAAQLQSIETLPYPRSNRKEATILASAIERSAAASPPTFLEQLQHLLATNVLGTHGIASAFVSVLMDSSTRGSLHLEASQLPGAAHSFDTDAGFSVGDEVVFARDNGGMSCGTVIATRLAADDVSSADFIRAYAPYAACVENEALICATSGHANRIGRKLLHSAHSTQNSSPQCATVSSMESTLPNPKAAKVTKLCSPYAVAHNESMHYPTYDFLPGAAYVLIEEAPQLHSPLASTVVPPALECSQLCRADIPLSTVRSSASATRHWVPTYVPGLHAHLGRIVHAAAIVQALLAAHFISLPETSNCDSVRRTVSARAVFAAPITATSVVTSVVTAATAAAAAAGVVAVESDGCPGGIPCVPSCANLGTTAEVSVEATKNATSVITTYASNDHEKSVAAQILPSVTWTALKEQASTNVSMPHSNTVTVDACALVSKETARLVDLQQVCELSVPPHRTTTRHRSTSTMSSPLSRADAESVLAALQPEVSLAAASGSAGDAGTVNGRGRRKRGRGMYCDDTWHCML